MLISVKKTFSKETFKLLNKDLNFVPTPKVYNKLRLNGEMETFYRTIKLKGYFADLNFQIFKLTNHKKCTPSNSHHMLLSYIKATQEEIGCTMENQKLQPFISLTKGKRTTL